MCNVFKFSLPVILAGALTMSSCGSDNKEQNAAEAALASADSLISCGDYTQALEALDSIEARYPQMIEVRRKAHDLRPVAVEKLTIKQIQSADSLIATTQQRLSELEGNFNHISGNGLEGYYLPKSYTSSGFTNTTGVQPRVNDADGMFYLVASNTGNPLNINQVALVIGGQEYASEVIPAASERSTKIEGGEIATFLPEEVNAIGASASEAGVPVTEIVLIGTKGRKKVKISPVQGTDIAKAWQYGTQKNQLKSALMLREKLDRRLQIARDQLANRIPDDLPQE